MGKDLGPAQLAADEAFDILFRECGIESYFHRQTETAELVEAGQD